MNTREVQPHPGPSKSTRATWVLLVLLLAGVLYLSYVMIRPFAGPLLAGIVMAVVFQPIYLWLQKKLRYRSLAAAVSTIVVVALIVGPLSFLILTITKQVRQALAGMDPNAVNTDRVWEVVERPLGVVSNILGTTPEEIRAGAMQKLSQASAEILKGGVTVLGAATGGVVFLTIAMVTFFFMLRDGHRFYKTVLAWSPLAARHTVGLIQSAQEMIIASAYGILAVAFAQGFTLGIGAWIVGLPTPLLWGVFTAGASVIPLLGSALIWIPAALVLILNGSIGKGIFMVAWGAGVVGNIDNLIRPLVVSSRIPLNALLIFIAMLGGVQSFGLMGIMIGPVVLAVGVTLARILREELRKDEELPGGSEPS